MGKSFQVGQITNKVKNQDIVLPISSYHQWFDAIIKDDVTSALSLLQSSEEQNENLTKGTFTFQCHLPGFDYDSARHVCLPFHLAVSHGSLGVADLLLQKGTNPLVVSEDGDNVLHSCVVTAFKEPNLESRICEAITWLQEKLTEDQWKKVLFQENKHGLYPLEFSAQQGCLLLFKQLLSSKGYVTAEEKLGLETCCLHDVTEYETGDRNRKSPIHFLSYLDKRVLKNKAHLEAITHPLISGWIDAKIKSNWILIFFWVFVRSLLVTPYFLLDTNTSWMLTLYPNNTEKYLCEDLSDIQLNRDWQIVLMVLIMTISCISLTRYIYDGLKSYCTEKQRRSHDLKGKKDVISATSFYINIQVILLLLLIISNSLFIAMLSDTSLYGGSVFLLVDIFRAVIPVLFVWSVCFFLQMVPAVGYSIISLQAMLNDVAKVMLLFLVILLPFVHVFQAFSLGSSVDGCLVQFSNPARTAYSLFMIMLNQIDLTQFSMVNPGVLYFLHFLYVVMVAIMLLNFLIAMMSTTAANFAENEEVALKINRLGLVVCLEDRLYDRCRWLYKRLRPFGFVCEDKKVYIKSVENRFYK